MPAAKYSDEFKTQVVREVIEKDRTIASVAASYDAGLEVYPELHRLGWFVFQGGVFRWDCGGGVVVSGH
ncbi:transposase [Actinomyces oris]|uniref:transposase n=1 Tax=Actinomyces oris TaxID=544580 RepID=UPI000AD6746D|nr:transposase [Actinomyces oris]